MKYVRALTGAVLMQRLSATASPEQKAKLLLLKDDPELKHVFEDIQSSGAEVMEKYWCAAQSGRSTTGMLVFPLPWPCMQHAL